MKSILQSKKRCLICWTEQNLHRHHVYEGNGLRQISEKYGLTVYLCAKHHNMSDQSVHLNNEMALDLKKWAQKKAMKYYGWSREDFRSIIHRDYCDDTDDD